MDPNSSVQDSGTPVSSPVMLSSTPAPISSSLSSKDLKSPSPTMKDAILTSESPNLTKDGKVKKKYDSSRRIGVKRGSYKKSYDKQALIGNGTAHLSDDEAMSIGKKRANSWTKRNSITSINRNSHSGVTPVYINEDRNLNYGANVYLVNNFPSNSPFYPSGSSANNPAYVMASHENPQIHLSPLQAVSHIITQQPNIPPIEPRERSHSRGIPIPVTASRKSSILSSSYTESPVQSLSTSISYEPHLIHSGSGTLPHLIQAGTPPQHIYGPTSYGYLNVQQPNTVNNIPKSAPDNIHTTYVNKSHGSYPQSQQNVNNNTAFVDFKYSPSTPSVTPPIRYTPTFYHDRERQERRESSNETIAYDVLNGHLNIPSNHSGNHQQQQQQPANVNPNPSQGYINVNQKINQSPKHNNGQVVLVERGFYYPSVEQNHSLHNSIPISNEENSLVSENDVFYVPR